VLINKHPSHIQCRIVAQMLGPDGIARPGDGAPAYYRTADVLAGRFEPEAK